MKLLKNYFYNVTYQLFAIILPIITIPYISRVLGATGVGINAYTNSIVSYFAIIANLGLSLYGNRTVAYIRNDKKKLTKFFEEMIVFRFLLGLIVLFLYIVFIILLGSTYRKFFVAQGITIIAIMFDISWLFMGLEDFKRTVIRNMLVKIISAGLIFIFVKEKDDLIIYILILSLSTLLGNLTLWPYVKRYLFTLSFSNLNLKQHFHPALQFFLPQVAIQIFSYTGKIMLGIFDSVHSVGYFENSDKIVRILLLVITSGSTVMLPRIANTYSVGDNNKIVQYLSTTFDLISAVTLPMMFGLIAIANSFSAFFFGSNFEGIGTSIMILSVQAIFVGWSSVSADQYLIPTNKLSSYTRSLLIGAIVNIILNLISVPIWGLYGACVTAVITEGIINFIQMKNVNKNIKIKPWFVNVPKYILASLIMLGLLFILNKTLPNTIITFILKITCGLISYILILLILKPTSIRYLKKIKSRNY